MTDTLSSNDSLLFRQAMGRFATGVTVITGRSDKGYPIGVTVSAFSSLSLEPPLILFCLNNDTRSLASFDPGRAFAVNMLAKVQGAISNVFAGPQDENFHGVAHGVGAGDVPLITGAVCSVECRGEAVYPGGDHQIIVGRVTAIHLAEDTDPLVYFASAYHDLGPRQVPD